MEWYKKVLSQYADFEGRARRKEYWMFALINTAVAFAVMIVFGGAAAALSEEALLWVGMGLLGVYFLAILVPSIAVSTRRLHDTNRSGWWQLLNLLGIIPFVGIIASIVLIVFYALDGNPGTNRYGPDPKAGERGFDGPGYSEADRYAAQQHGYPPPGQVQGGYPQQGYPTSYPPASGYPQQGYPQQGGGQPPYGT